MISTHILDTHLGKPAANVTIHLYDAQGQRLATSTTNNDGRVSDFDLSEFLVGDYSLEFEIAVYFSQLNTHTFFPKVVIHFSVTDAKQHYHIPLLISPYAYSTYRGS